MSKLSIYSRPSRFAIAISTFATVVSTPSVFAQAAEGGDALEEITITAQRREESLQKSSLAIEVMSEEALQKAGVKQASDITAMTPGVQVGGGGPQPQIYIRGIGDYGATSVSNPAIAFNVDGVYIARSTAIAGNFFDIGRMEVLKGPQGTLYGRNASGGAINLIPNEPRLGELEGYAEVGLQNYNGTSAEAAVSIPLGDSLALRVSAQAVNRDGYLSDGSNDDVHQSGRVQVLWKPSENFDVRLWGSYSHSGGKGQGFALYDPAGNTSSIPLFHRAPSASFDPWTSIASPQGNALIAEANNVLNIQNNLDPSTVIPGQKWLDDFDSSKVYQDLNFYNVHATANWHMDWATLTVIPAYQSSSMAYHTYPGISYEARGTNGEPETSYATSLETRLSNNTEKFKWVVGGFYYDENQQSHSTIDNGFQQRLTIAGEQVTKSYAAFGQTTYSVSDPFRLIAGLRYTKEEKTALYNRYNIGFSSGCNPGSTPATFAPGGLCFFDTVPTDPSNRELNNSATNFRVGTEYDVSEQSMLFLTVASGFKAGGISQADVEPFKPEKLLAYTIGSRNRFLGESLQVNVEGFYYDYKDHQEFVVASDNSGKVGAFTLNAGNAKSYGASLDVQWAPVRNDKFRIAGEYVHATYDTFEYNQPTLTIAQGSTNCRVVDTGQGNVALGGGVFSTISHVDCGGQQMIRTPKWSGLGSYTHTFVLGSEGTLDAGVNVSYASERYLTTAFIENVLAPSYTLWNADLTYNNSGDNVQLSGFIRNITNEAVYTGASQNTFRGALVGANIGAPRTYGARLRVKF